jgi:hypothetical protein
MHTTCAGAGAQCEGEDWSAISEIASLDVDIVHVYDRQVRARLGNAHLARVCQCLYNIVRFCLVFDLLCANELRQDYFMV